jgi:hypothetical protein
MNKTDNTKQVRHGILLVKCLHLPKPGTTTIKLSKTSTSKQLLYKLCFTFKQPIIHETAGLFPVKIEKKTVLYFCKLFNEIYKKCVHKKSRTQFWLGDSSGIIYHLCFDRVCTRACA